MTPDPYRASGGPADPGSWNRYMYVGGDPMSRFDPKGLYWCSPLDREVESDSDCYDPGVPGNPSPGPPYLAPLTTADKLVGVRDVLKRTDGQLGKECLDYLGKLNATEGAYDRAGNPAPPVNASTLKDAFSRMEFYNLNTQPSVLKSYLWHLTEIYEDAKTSFGTITVLADVKSGFAAELFGKTVYFTDNMGGELSAPNMAASLLHEALHLLGYSEARLKETIDFDQMKKKCIDPLQVTY